ncbi:MAG TPA: methyltetrahydrofolate--corrinoid methyltransferase [Syntrophobacteraceae bacterium]|nr:methyltetrahydrofolate--corrinoid methyltransferase [Syntrophobacteraceae bacterium]
MEIIGEKINTTRKTVEKAVRERDATFIQDLARKQAEAGATYLDVNSGMPLYAEEEAEDFAWLVPVIQEAVDLPLCIDSTHQQVIEKALSVHKGRAMINSINGDPPSMEAILPLARQYQCKVVAMTSSKEAGIPANSTERVEIAQTIATKAGEYGVPLEDIYFDPLVLSLATDNRSALVFFETLKEIKKRMPGARTISGLSNISYGLPKRKLLNHAFLVICLGYGMDAAILDPTDKTTMALIQTTEALIGKDAYCANYLRAFRAGLLDP